jgi:hypothetical protein
LIRRRVADLDAQINRLAALRAEMMSMAERIPAVGTMSDCPQPTPGTWCPPGAPGTR